MTILDTATETRSILSGLHQKIFRRLRIGRGGARLLLARLFVPVPKPRNAERDRHAPHVNGGPD
jgi:hypothetical protein